VGEQRAGVGRARRGRLATRRVSSELDRKGVGLTHSLTSQTLPLSPTANSRSSLVIESQYLQVTHVVSRLQRVRRKQKGDRLVDHHDAEEHAEDEKEETVDVVLDRVADRHAEREEEDAADREEADTK